MAFKTRLAGTALFALTLTGAAQAQEASDVVATVNGVEITLGHMIQTRARLPQQYQQLPNDVLWDGILDQLVQQTLLAAQLAEDPARVQITLQNETRSLRAGVVIDEIVTAAVTDEALQAAYDASIEGQSAETEWNASHILVETEAEALDIIARLESGDDFAELAQELSTGPSGPNGGQLGWFATGMMVPTFEDAVRDMEIGGISNPVQTQFGWHVVTLNDKREAAIPALDEVRDQLVGQLQQTALEDRLTELTDAADIAYPEEGAFDPALLSDFAILEE